MAAYIQGHDAVIVMCMHTGKEKVFSGYLSIKPMFEEFYNGISENTNYEDAISHFTPNIAPFIVNK